MSILKSISSIIFPEKEKIKYDFVERKIDEEMIHLATRIISGPLKGLIFSTGPVTITEDAGTIKLNYQYRIEFQPKELVEIDEELLSTTIGDIIMEEIEKSQQN